MTSFVQTASSPDCIFDGTVSVAVLFISPRTGNRRQHTSGAVERTLDRSSDMVSWKWSGYHTRTLASAVVVKTADEFPQKPTEILNVVLATSFPSNLFSLRCQICQKSRCHVSPCFHCTSKKREREKGLMGSRPRADRSQQFHPSHPSCCISVEPAQECSASVCTTCQMPLGHVPNACRQCLFPALVS